jgi:hypothetical protein
VGHFIATESILNLNMLLMNVIVAQLCNAKDLGKGSLIDQLI